MLCAVIVLLAITGGTSGFSSCAGATGPLFAPLVITPSQVLLRTSVGSGEAVGLARVDGISSSEKLLIGINFGKGPDVRWLSVEVVGRSLTLHASPAEVDPGVYSATVTVEVERSGATGNLQVEFTVLP